jgi:UDP-N-acetylmuramoyl-tripeptide--D-alanyl-D-alanine ligase
MMKNRVNGDTMKSMIFTARIKKKLYLTVVRYFRFWASSSLRRWKPRVIAVTGSVGKTTLLNLLEVQLGERAHYSHNANSSYGIAFDILGMDGVRGSKLKWFYLFIAAPIRSLWFRHAQEFYVVEIDGERPKETEFLASWLKPEVTLWVSVGRTHAVYFDGQVKTGQFKTVEDAIVHEFSFLPKYTSKLVAYDADSDLIRKAMQGIIGARTVGVSEKALASYAVWSNKTEFVVNDATYTFTEPMPREVYVQLALLGALAEYLGEPVVTDLSDYVQPPGRSNFFAGKKGVQLIDSSYNAHLISMESIINLYKDMRANEKWIVIGDIVEQGEAEADEHTRLGELLRAADFDRYVLVGRRTQKYTYLELDAAKSVTFLRPKDAVKYLEGELTGKETVLFKGSQYLEGVIEHLLADPADAAKLPRQEPAAKKRRARWGL